MRTHALLLAAALAAAPAASLTVLTGSAKAPDGVEIRYEAAGNGEPAIVFVHGWSCDRSYWSRQAAHFAKGRRIVAIDLAGRGESGRERQRYPVEAFGADVKAVVDALGLKRMVLVGHSMGGPVILEAARLMPAKVAALVAIDTLGRVGEKTRHGAIRAPGRGCEARGERGCPAADESRGHRLARSRERRAD